MKSNYKKLLDWLETAMDIEKLDIAHLMKHCKFDNDFQCWEWTGPTLKTGYGSFIYEGVQYQAHRISWELANRQKIPGGKVLMHLCDKRNCINPQHLRPGTKKENYDDAVAKGRVKSQKQRIIERLEKAGLDPDDYYFTRISLSTGLLIFESDEKAEKNALAEMGLINPVAVTIPVKKSTHIRLDPYTFEKFDLLTAKTNYQQRCKLK